MGVGLGVAGEGAGREEDELLECDRTINSPGFV